MPCTLGLTRPHGPLRQMWRRPASGGAVLPQLRFDARLGRRDQEDRDCSVLRLGGFDAARRATRPGVPDVLFQTAFFTDAKAVLERHGGTVEKFIGDAVMAVFGHPASARGRRASRSSRGGRAPRGFRAAEQAGQAGARRTSLDPDRRQHRRGGGGDPVGGQAFVTGDAVNVASGSKPPPEPGEILIGVDTQRLVRDAALVEPVEDLVLKGEGGAGLGLAAACRRQGGSGLRPAVRRGPRRPGARARHSSARIRPRGGREDRSSLHHSRRRRSRQVASAARAPRRDRRGRNRLSEASACPTATESILALERHRADSRRDRPDRSPDVARARIAALLEGDPEAERVVERLAAAMGLDDRQLAAEETFWAARRLLEALARERPVVVVFDDLHWAEPTFLDLVEHLGDRARDAPIVLVCLARPELLELRPVWAGGKVNTTTMLLEPLSLEESELLIRNLLRDVDPGPEMCRTIAEAADGNPLFLEEILAMLLDEGSLEQREPGLGEVSTIRVPATIPGRSDRAPRPSRRRRARGDRDSSGDGRVLPPAEPGTVARRCRPGYAARRAGPEGVDPSGPAHQRAGVSFSAPRDPRRRVQPDPQGAPRRPPRAFRRPVGASVRGPSRRDRGAARLPPRARLGPLCGAPAGGRPGSAARRPRRCPTGGGGRAGVCTRGHPRSGQLARASRAAARGRHRATRFGAARSRVGTPRGRGPGGGRILPCEAAAVAAASDRPHLAWRVAVERSSLAAYLDPSVQADDLLRVAAEAIDAFEQSGDELGLAKASLHVAEVHWMRCNCGEMEDALERAIVHAERAGATRERSWALGSLCRAAVLGPRSVEEAIERCEGTRSRAGGDIVVAAYADSCTAVLEAMRGRPGEARALFRRTQETLDDVGLNVLLASMRMYAGWAELILGEPALAARELQVGYDALARIGERAIPLDDGCLPGARLGGPRQGRRGRGADPRQRGGRIEGRRRVTGDLARDAGEGACGPGRRERRHVGRGRRGALPWHRLRQRSGRRACRLRGDDGPSAVTRNAQPALTEALRLYDAKGNVASARAIRPFLAELQTPTRG